MGRIEELIEKQLREQRLRRIASRFQAPPVDIVASEWQPAPLGRMGRLLWTDIERYLEFVEIARSDVPEPTTARRARGRPFSMTYSMFE